MTVYTTRLRTICKNLTGKSNDEEALTAAIPIIFDFSFPSPSDEVSARIEEKFLRHYWMQEISCETFSLWKWNLKEKLNLIMPHYVQRYNSVVDFDILSDTKYTIVDSGTGNSESFTQSNQKNKFSNTPQGGLNGLEKDQYLTTADITSADANSGTNTNTNSNRVVSGKTGGNSYAKLVQEYRDIILNIDAEIIYDLEDLFIQIY